MLAAQDFSSIKEPPETRSHGASDVAPFPFGAAMCRAAETQKGVRAVVKIEV